MNDIDVSFAMNSSPYIQPPLRPLIAHDNQRGGYIAWNWDALRWDDLTKEQAFQLRGVNTTRTSKEPE